MNNKFILIILLILSFVLSNESFAQKDKKYTTISKKAIKKFEGGKTFLDDKQYDNAIDYFHKAIALDQNFVEPYIFLGDLYFEIKEADSSLLYYQKAIEINPDFFPKLMYMTGRKELELGYYDIAHDHFVNYLKSPKHDKTLDKELERLIKNCRFAMEMIANPVPFNPENLGKSVNTENDEYVNSVSTDENLLIFTRKRLMDENTIDKRKSFEEDFYTSSRDTAGNWKLAILMNNRFNTHGNEGAMCISPDGKMLVFAADQRDESMGRFDLYYSRQRGNIWTTPKNLGNGVNTEAWESQPSISADGSTIYFVSDRRGGSGGSDIWKVSKDKDGFWGNPVNLGDVINTNKNEMTPFIHQDGKTLYFASQGHDNMGGFDFFYSKMDESGKWSEPINLGYPINTHGNEIGLIINAKGTIAYISSDRLKDGYGLDIYSFPLYELARPSMVSYMKGIVLDAETNQVLEANFELIDLNSSKTIISSVSDPSNGSYFVCIPSKADLGLNVQKSGYLFYSEHFNIEGNYEMDKPFEKIIYLKKIRTGEKIVLNNIFFESASYDLKNESMVELAKLLNLLQKNPGLKVEIGGHTDNIGKDEDNQKLSENRAKVVVDYLISKGIDKARLSYKGYGETMPIADNNTEEGRKLNRRTEMKVTGI